MRSDVRNIEGQVFGYVTALSPLRKNNRVYWNCICICGEKKDIRSDRLRSGEPVNCGCKTKQMLSENGTLPEGEAHLRLAIHHYRKSAKKRGLCFELTNREFKDIIIRPCAYCGEEPTIENSAYKRPELKSYFAMNGVDRVDSSIGYKADNCVPCCSKCNQIKMNMSLKEFVEKIAKIHSHMQIGLGGYVVGRSGEKIANNLKGKKDA